MERKRLKQLSHQPGVDPELLRIYRDGDGQLPDISRLQVYRPNWARRWLLVVLALSVITGGGIWAWSAVGWVTSHREPEPSVAITVQAPPQLASGEEVTYRITYINIDRVTLRDVQLTLRYPVGFTFQRAVPRPVNQYQNTWQLGHLTPGMRGEIQLTAKVVGAVGGIVTLAGTVTYQPENFSSSFKDEFLHTSQITSSILTLLIASSERVVAEREFTYALTYANTSAKALSGVLVQVRYPPGFVFRQATPAPKLPPVSLDRLSGALSTQPNSTWYLATVPPHASSTVTISGGFASDQSGSPVNQERELTAHIGFLDETGSFSVQQVQQAKTVLVAPNFQLNLIVNGSQSGQPVDFGTTLQYRLVYKNLGADPLGDVILSVSVDSTVVDWDTFKDANLGQRDGTTIRWDKNSRGSLAQLAALDEGTIDFSLQLKPVSAIGETTQDLQTSSTAEARIGTVSAVPADLVIRAVPVINPVNTAVELVAQGRYFDDDNLAVGAGPLPPVVGQTTTFRITWGLANSLHPVERVTVSTKLSSGVTWGNKLLSSTGDLGYNPETREVTWTIAKLAASRTSQDVNAWFDISVTPKQDQVGKLLLLTSETTLAATDTVTKSSVVGLRRSLTSNLEDDPFVGGRGLVVELGQ